VVVGDLSVFGGVNGGADWGEDRRWKMEDGRWRGSFARRTQCPQKSFGPGRRRDTAGGTFVSFFLGIGRETGNEAGVEAGWPVFIGDFEGFLVSRAGMKTAQIAI
jgi:hypothetical protein